MLLRRQLVNGAPRLAPLGTVQPFASLDMPTPNPSATVLPDITLGNPVEGESIYISYEEAKQYLADHWARLLTPGSRGIFIGKVGEFNHNLQLTHPDFVMIDTRGQVTGRKTETKRQMERAVQRSTMVGLYPASAKLPTWAIADSVALVLPEVVSMGDTLPAWVVDEAGVANG